MPMSEDLTLAVLIEIRDEIRATNQRVDVTNSRLEQLGTDLRGEIARTRDELRGAIEQTSDELRGEIAQTRDEVRGAIAQTREELRGEIAQTRHELRGEIVGVELRNATRVTEQTAATRDLYTLLSGHLDVRDRLTQVEHDVEELKKRVG